MGSASSKDSAAAESPSPSSSSSGGLRALRSRVFSASCFGLPSTLIVDDLDDHKNDATNGDARQSKMPAPLSLPQVRDRERSRRSLSRFGFIPDRIGERLSRTVSLRSLRARSVTSDTQSVANSEGEDLNHEQALETSSHNVDSHSETEENVNIIINSSSQDIVRGNAIESSSQRDRVESEISEDRRYNRRISHHEPLEGSVRFSRTLSVGRLRDRVLRRTSSSTGTFGDALLQDRANEQLSEVRALGGRRRVPLSSSYEVWPDFARSYLSHDQGTDMLQLREAGNQDSVEHRSAFLDRRRRIRSQVRALQRLGSRFENLSGHERSCILSGQHRTGRCACRASNRAGSANDNSSSRASISRIVMLAEALFEVLDEIHQQSVALSSRPSFSSIGSVPAPKEIVDCMPLKVYMRPQKQENEEAAQCYICLVEYEDGDSMRMLPCSHEFHRTCIDKWLKEIHRVCPLCRGDVCRSDTLGINKY